MREKDLFLPVKLLLESSGFKVYAEVLVKQTPRTVDVVGLNDLALKSVAVELKLKFNKKLIEQAVFNATLFDLSYLAIPQGLKFTPPLGIGVIEVDLEKRIARETVAPQTNTFRPNFNNLKSRLFINSLNEIVHGGERASLSLSSKNQVLAQVKNLLHQKPRMSFEELLTLLNTHYTDPKKSVRELINLDPSLELIEGIVSLKKPEKPEV